MKKVYMISWDGFQDQEVIYPYYRLQEYGFNVEIYGQDKEEIVGLFGTKFKCLGGCPTDYDADILVLPGGVKALEKVRQNVEVLEYIRNWPENKVISSICHGAQLLISAGKTKSKVVSAYYSIKDDINNSGGTYSKDVVVDSNIVSGAHYKDMPEWMRETISLYERLQISNRS